MYSVQFKNWHTGSWPYLPSASLRALKITFMHLKVHIIRYITANFEANRWNSKLAVRDQNIIIFSALFLSVRKVIKERNSKPFKCVNWTCYFYKAVKHMTNRRVLPHNLFFYWNHFNIKSKYEYVLQIYEILDNLLNWYGNHTLLCLYLAWFMTRPFHLAMIA